MTLTEFVRNTERHNRGSYTAVRAHPNIYSGRPNDHCLEVIWRRGQGSGFICTYFTPETLVDTLAQVIAELEGKPTHPTKPCQVVMEDR